MSSLQPIKLKKFILVEGTVLYNDGRRRIDLKRPIVNVLEKLDQKDKVVYAMELYLSKNEFKERIEQALEEGRLPVLLWFKKAE